jgi:hypothetical protein
VDSKLDSLPSLNLGFVAFEGFTSGTDEQSGPDSYEETVETAIEYVQRVFPTTRVNAYRHDVRVAGEWIPGDPSGETPGEFLFDLLGTHIELQSMLAEHGKVVAGKVTEGTVYTVTDGTVVESSDGIEMESFDETVVVMPDGYFDFHQRDVYGIHARGKGPFHPPISCAVLEADALPSQLNAGENTAHEIGHHFCGDLYSGKYRLFSRRNDPYHAADSIRLAKIAFPEGSPTIEKEVKSFMRSVGEDQWVDEIVYTKLFDNATEQDSFTPTPPMNSTIVGTGGAVVEAKLISVVVSLERKMEVLDATMHWGIEVAEDTTDTIEKAGEVAVDVVDQAGSTLASVSPPDGVSVSPAEGESREVPHVPFVLPHPEGTYEVRVEYQEETTGFYPVTATLRHTVGRVPDRGFENDPGTGRAALGERITTVENALDSRNFTDTREALAAFEEAANEHVRDEYDGAANQYTGREVAELTDDLIEHTRTLEATDDGANLPDWLPYVGGASVLGLGAGMLKYLKGFQKLVKQKMAIDENSVFILNQWFQKFRGQVQVALEQSY